MWYENLPGFRRKNCLKQALQIILIGAMFPIYSLAYLVAPKSQMGRYIKKPFIKFICHSASYITFLVILILASQRIEAFYRWPGIRALFLSTARRDYDHEHTTTTTTTTTTSAANSSATVENLAQYLREASAQSKKSGALPTPIEVVILFWVMGLIWAEWKQIRALRLEYYRDNMWNTLDSVANSFYIACISLRLLAYLQQDEASSRLAREHWGAYDSTLLSEGLFAAATIFSALKLLYIFLVNPYLGPLQISLGRMIIDILKFAWIYALVLFAFACGMNQLLWYYADLERHQCISATHSSLVQTTTTATATTIPPPASPDSSCKVWRHFSNVFESSQTLFWATFGLVDLENFDLTGIKQYTRFWALLMFGVYCFINVVVVLNLLIAMMNHSYEKISDKSDVEWKFARTRLWMSYFDTGSTVPPPFNILPSVKWARQVCRFVRSRLLAKIFFVGVARPAKKCQANELDLLAGHMLGRNRQTAAHDTPIVTIKVPQESRREPPPPGSTTTGQADHRPDHCPLAGVRSPSELPDQVRNRCRKCVCQVDHSGRYQEVIKALIRRYIVSEQRALEKNRELTEDDCNEIKQEVRALRYEMVSLLGARFGLRDEPSSDPGSGPGPGRRTRQRERRLIRGWPGLA